jgi:hypothetical protein
MTDATEKVERAIARFERVARHIDERGGATRDAAQRERHRLNASLGRTVLKLALGIGLVWVAIVVIGLVKPVGMIGFAAALLATVVLAVVMIARGGREAIAPPAPATDLPNGAMVERFDSYLFRARRSLPAPAQQQIDSISAALPALKQTLERLDPLDPDAQDARRLMSVHLPGLVDRYMNVPAAYRGEQDGEGKTVDQRLVEGLAAARSALNEASEQLARRDIAALETQGRFIRSRYGQQGVPNEDAPTT